MTFRTLKDGRAATVSVWGKDENEFPALRFVKTLDKKAQGKFKALTDTFAENGELWNREQFKHLKGKIYELRIPGYRIFCFIDSEKGKKNLICTHGVKKQHQKAHPSEIEKVERIRGEYLEWKEKFCD